MVNKIMFESQERIKNQEDLKNQISVREKYHEVISFNFRKNKAIKKSGLVISTRQWIQISDPNFKEKMIRLIA